MSDMGYAGEARWVLTWLSLGFTGCLENENPSRMSQGLDLVVVLDILLECLVEEMMSDGILSTEIGVKCYLDDVQITFTPNIRLWSAFISLLLDELVLWQMVAKLLQFIIDNSLLLSSY